MKFAAVTAIFLVVLINGAFTKPAGVILGFQDNQGQYSFGFSAPHQARSEVRSLDGITRGSYSYVDPAGLIQSADYTADGLHGFRIAATNLPQAPFAVQETAEVAAARAAHLLALEKAEQDAQRPEEPDSVTILSKSAESETSEKEEKDASLPAKLEEPKAQTAEEPQKESHSEIQTSEALAEAEKKEKDADLKKEEEMELKKEKKTEMGKAIEEPTAAVAPVIASPAALLPVPLIPVNFDLPTISAYSSRPAGAKADLTTLPQSTSAQGGSTPASTTLKTLTGSSQLVAISPQIALTGEQLSNLQESTTTTASGKDTMTQFERARAVFAPVGSVNALPLGFDPATSSFFRYSPFPYVTYNIL